MLGILRWRLITLIGDYKQHVRYFSERFSLNHPESLCTHSEMESKLPSFPDGNFSRASACSPSYSRKPTSRYKASTAFHTLSISSCKYTALRNLILPICFSRPVAEFKTTVRASKCSYTSSMALLVDNQRLLHAFWILISTFFSPCWERFIDFTFSTTFVSAADFAELSKKKPNVDKESFPVAVNGSRYHRCQHMSVPVNERCNEC